MNIKLQYDIFGEKFYQYHHRHDLTWRLQCFEFEHLSEQLSVPP